MIINESLQFLKTEIYSSNPSLVDLLLSEAFERIVVSFVRKSNCRRASGTHIKAVDKRTRALIVRRSSIHEVGGYGYTYVLSVRTPRAEPCRTRAHAHGLSRVWSLRVVTTEIQPCMVKPHTSVESERSGADRERERE